MSMIQVLRLRLPYAVTSAVDHQISGHRFTPSEEQLTIHPCKTEASPYLKVASVKLPP